MHTDSSRATPVPPQVTAPSAPLRRDVGVDTERQRSTTEGRAVDTLQASGHCERMRVSVLGAAEVDGGVVALAPRDRVVLAVLALRRGMPVRAETLTDALWGNPPESATKVVQGCIVRLRRALGPAAIRTTAAGYALMLHRDEVDVAVFEDLVTRARGLLASGQPDRVRYLADRARLLWRGEPFADIADWAPAVSEIDRLGALLHDVEELRVEAELALGLHAQAVPELVGLVRAEPDREHRWALLALAQYRSDRQAEALATLQRARSHLVSTLGVDPGPELRALVAAILRHEPILEEVPGQVDDDTVGCPYPGLAPYEAADAETFFGRDSDVAACLRRLEEKGVVVLVGPSGCGKSSVLRAGIAATFLSDGRRVEVLNPGPRPAALLDERTIGPNVVLVVDQGEEVFAAPLEEARAFLVALVAHVHKGGLLALALRADRMGELANHPETARLVEEGLILLGPLTEDGLRRSIEGPAAQAGLQIEPGLVELLVNDVLGEPGALPLLSHVLRRTWEQREGRTLTVAGYRATGGVRGAVAQSAEAVFLGLSADEQTALRQLMTRLVGLDDRGDLVRQRLARESVSTDRTHTGVIGTLVEARLLSVDGDTVEISHESLAVAWPRLRSWLDEDVEGIRIMRHLSVAAASWATLDRPSSELYRGVRQARAAEWADRMRPALSAVEREFLDASAELAVREEQSAVTEARRERVQNRRLRAGLALVGGLLVAALLAGSLAVSASREARAQAVAADARRLGAEALRARDLDTGLLLAASAVGLHEDADTRAALLAALDKSPALVQSARVRSAFDVAVHPQTGHVLMSTADGLYTHDPLSLARVDHEPSLKSWSVVSGTTGGVAAAVVWPSHVGVGDLPAIVLLDGDGRRLPDSLGGIPRGAFAFQTISLSSDGRWLAASMLIDSETLEEGADLRPPLIVWDLQRPGTPVLSMRLETPAGAPAVLDDGRTLVHLTDGELVVRSLPTGEVTHRRTAEDLRSRYLYDVLSVAPDGGALAVAGAGEVVMVDTTTWEATGHLVEVDGVQSIAFSPDGSLLAVGGDSLIVWRLGDLEPPEILREDDGGGQIAFSRDGGSVFATDFANNLLTAWDLTGQRGFLLAAPPPAAPVPEVPRISPDGTRVLHVQPHPEPALRVRDVATGAVSPLVAPQQRSTSYIDSAWSPDGSVVTMSTGVEDISLWDSRTGALRARTKLPDGEGVSMSVFTRDGAALLAGTTQGRLHILDSETLKPLADPLTVAPDNTPDGERAIDNLEPGPDGRVLAMLSEGTLVVDLVTRTTAPIDVTAFGAGWSPEGERVFVTMKDGRVGILDSATWRWVTEPTGAQPFAGWIVTYSPDGDRVVTMAGGRAGLFDGRTGEFLGSVTVGNDGTAAFAADGRSVVIAENGGRVRTWDLDPSQWMGTACRMAGRALTEQEWREYLPDRDYIAACGAAP